MFKKKPGLMIIDDGNEDDDTVDFRPQRFEEEKK